MVASLVLTTALALVAVPGPAGSRTPSGTQAAAPERFELMMLDAASAGTVPSVEDPALRSGSALGKDSVLPEPAAESVAPAHPAAPTPSAAGGSVAKNPWRLDHDISWYGPGFYGHRTACGVALTTTVIGVAHRSLPCGTRIEFRNPANGRTIVATVVDRGPYVSGRIWDMTAGLCRALGHCYTGSIFWRYG